MLRLDNPVMGYAWGSRTALAELQGREPTATPEAELWLGAHPSAPSRVQLGDSSLPLDQLIARDPVAALGAERAARFRGQLPFLFKVLAAEQPLSLQAHPSRDQARQGFAREEMLGVPIADPSRNYRDPHAKPELVCALSRLTALSGFRPLEDAVATLRAFGLDAAANRLEAAADSPSALRAQVEHWLRGGAGHAADELAQARARAEQLRGGDRDRDAHWVLRLSALHPRDPGVLVSLLLQRFELQPGEALTLDAGNLHAYLEGTAIEVMANSDNVLRGGMTVKHVDVDELLHVLRFDAPPIERTRPQERAPGVFEYRTPFPEFSLLRVELGASQAPPIALHSAAIALCTAGSCALRSPGGEPVALRRGESVYLAANERRVELSGQGQLYLATAGTES